MKILYFAVGGRYGSDKSLIDIIDFVRNEGHQVYVVMNKCLGLEKELEQRGIRFKSFSFYQTCFQRPLFLFEYLIMPLRYLRNYIRLVLSILKGLKVVLEFRPDIIHTNTGLFQTGFEISKLLKIPHVWHLREYEDKDFGSFFIYGKSVFIHNLKAPHNYPIAISGEIYSYFSLQSVKNSVIIYNGIIRREEKQQGRLKEHYFIYVGNVNPNKGVTDMIESFCKIPNINDWQLKICGEFNKDYFSYLQERFSKYPNYKSIIFMGYQSDVSSLISTALGIIVPSYFEAFGRTVVEAMNLRCLVIGRNSAGIKEQLDRGVSLTGGEIGIRFNSPVDLTIQLSAVINSEEYVFEDIIERAEKTVHHYYNVEKMGNSIVNLYDYIIN